ncbi:LysR family transcriptional regulator [Kordiimonas gwangyangensis]|uniref:LysR family transcriptional regulator n=1 Tax=Kordiimonas gwangyangensis TaxID=288022 RepID=UPI0003765AEC|nr:LysR family transcriptional regulator [Kordiimonas gwangyangensis]
MALLVTFDTLMETRSVSGAAKLLSVTQSATSHNLNRLRRLFDDPLFVRVGHEMQPTVRALELAEPVGAALAVLGETLRNSGNFNPLISDRVFRLAVTDYVEAICMPTIVKLLAEAAPGIHIVSLPTFDNHLGRMGRSVDLAFGRFEKVPSQFHQAVLWQEKFVVIAAADHPRLRENSLTLEQYLAEKHVLISPNGKRRGLVDEMLAERGQERTVQHATRGFSAPARLVAVSELIATIPERMARLQARELPIRCYEPPLPLGTFDYKMIWPPMVHTDPAHKWMRTLLKAKLPSATFVGHSVSE